MDRTDALIVGAGPTGLALALFLARQGVRPRVVDRRSGPGEASRAMVVQARTLEFYRQLGFAEEVVAAGIRVERLELRERGRTAVEAKLGDMGAGASPYPFVLSFPQDEHERLLAAKARAAGVEVEWNTEWTGFEQTDAATTSTLRPATGATGQVEAAYLFGCDGAGSAVRGALGLEFAGGTYDQLFFVADVASPEARFERAFQLNLGRDEFLAVFPIRSNGHLRLIGLVPPALAGGDVGFDDLRAYVEASNGLRPGPAEWFSTYRVHHRMTPRFRVGRAFLAGDACHVHSPVGGQGMNTGIGDAVNLAWKAAAVLGAGASPDLLDSYEPERMRFARGLLATTDRVFTAAAGGGLGGELFRDVFAAHIAPWLLGFDAVRHAAFGLVSQTRIEYSDSPLSAGSAGGVRGGDRLPYVSLPSGDNFAPLRELAWHAHVYGAGAAELERGGFPVRSFPWSESAERAGFEREAAYLVRPDGHVALAGADAALLRAYAETWGLRSDAGQSDGSSRPE